MKLGNSEINISYLENWELSFTEISGLRYGNDALKLHDHPTLVLALNIVVVLFQHLCASFIYQR